MPLYWIWFAQLKSLTLHKKRQLLSLCPDPAMIYDGRDENLQDLDGKTQKALMDKDLTQAHEILAQCRQLGIGIVTFFEDNYPPRLRSLLDPPLVLYYKGKLPDWRVRPAIGVVGTRKATPYGLHWAYHLSAQIAACGGLVVSGGAAGVDKRAMEGALSVGCPTVGVVASGLDIVYPAENRKLFRRTEENGCILSQYPPGTRPYRGQFLQRNRIISGLSNGVLVVEAPERSGALSTAHHAADQGRDLFAVPGNLDSAASCGSNGLLQTGAYPALSGWDVMKLYAAQYPGVVENRPVQPPEMPEEPAQNQAEPAEIPGKSIHKKETLSQKSIDNLEKSTYSVLNKRPAQLSDQESQVYDLLTEAPQYPDAILDGTELPAAKAQAILTRLAIRGLVQQYPDGRVSRK